MIYENILQTIGHTPLVKLKRSNPTKANILMKIEYFNPALSAKDRPSYRMIQDALDQGEINHDTTLIEPTSGNTGIGLAMVAAVLGLKMMVVMPDSMSMERRKAIAGYGAKLVLTPGKLGMQGAVDEAERLHTQIPNSFIPSQFNNPSNPKAHALTTGPEIMEDTGGNIDAFVAGIGTGGTLTGTGKFLKSVKPTIKIIGVEPASSPLITKGTAGPHKIQGIGANFIPKNLDCAMMDETLDITDEQALTCAKQLMSQEGIAAGISSGAAVAGACIVGARKEYEGKTIVVLLPDSAARYLSTELFEKGE